MVDIWMLSIGVLTTDSGLLCEDERVMFSCEVWRFPEPYKVLVIQAEENHRCAGAFTRGLCNLGRDMVKLGDRAPNWGVRSFGGLKRIESYFDADVTFMVGEDISGLIQLGWDPGRSLITVPMSIWSGARAHVVNLTASR